MSFFRRKGRSAAAVVAIVGLVSLFGASPATSVTGLGAPTLDPASDTGESSSDGVTNANSLSFLAVGTLADGEKWQLLEDGMPVGTASATSPIVYGSGVTPSPAGTHVYKMRVVDSMNATVEDSAGITVTVDRTAPTATAGAPDLDAANDSGASATDNITKSTARSFAVAVSDGPIAADERLQLLRVGTPVVAGATSPLTDTAAVDGSYAYTARVIDAAGNASAPSPATSVTIDTVALPPGVALTTASDTGRSSSDGITTTLNQVTGLHTTTLAFNFSGETGAVLSSWTRKIGAAAAAPRTFASAATTQAMPAGTATATDAVGVLATIAPANGSYLYTVVQTDLAGNVSTPGSTTVILDTVAPAPAVVTLDSTTDSGPSSSDG
ncbi:MAG: Ig-like domain-containing protein, partial [Actinomycetota bacterium]|nr:Ig-like domain-containing protein [Actinomycetota bacterium]